MLWRCKSKGKVEDIMRKEPLIKSHTVATVAFRDGVRKD